MIVALNIGNTHVAYGLVENGSLTSTGHVPTPTADATYQLEMVLDEIVGHARRGTDSVEIVAASVVPRLSEALREIATRRRFSLLEADESTVPMPMRSVTGRTAGHDRLTNAFAAARLHGTPVIVVDMGTATTFEAVDESGAFLGGAIAAGIGLGLDALASRTAQLPRVPVALPGHAIGQTTVEAIQSGTVLGHVGLVDYLIRAITTELGNDTAQRPKVVLTGGLSSHPWARAIPGVDAIDPLLTLRGLALLHSEIRMRPTVAQA